LPQRKRQEKTRKDKKRQDKKKEKKQEIRKRKRKMELNFIFKYYDREFFESGIGGEREVKSDRKSRPQFKKPKEKTQRLFLSPPWTNARGFTHHIHIHSVISRFSSTQQCNDITKATFLRERERRAAIELGAKIFFFFFSLLKKVFSFHFSMAVILFFSLVIIPP